MFKNTKKHRFAMLKKLVGTSGFEPPTSSMSRKRSNQLSYAPARQRTVAKYEAFHKKNTHQNNYNPALIWHYHRKQA